MTSKKRFLGTAAVAVALGLGVSGCAASPDSSSTPGEDGTLTKVTLSVNPIPQNAAILLGIEEGIFEKHGLEVEIVPQPDVAAIVSGVASGQYDFGFVTVTHLVNANANGIPLRAVATVDGVQPDHEEPDESTGLVAGPNSGIKSVADLEGKTLAVVGLESLGTFTAYELADRAGVDFESIELLQLPFGQMPAALASGDVDAAVIQAPFLGQALAEGSLLIGQPNVEVLAGTNLAFYAASEQFTTQAPETTKAFHDAVIESQVFTLDHLDDARALLADFLGIAPEAAAGLSWNTSSSDYSVKADGIAVAQDLMQKYGDLTKITDPKDMVWAGVNK